MTACVLQEAFSVMKINSEQINDILSLLSAILNLGNVQFITAGGAQVKDMKREYGWK